jgi:hypothetical protein
LRDVIVTAMSSQGGEQVVNLERRIQKQLLLEEARRAVKERSPPTAAPRSKSPDLGKTSLTGVVPFAVDGAITPRPHSARITCRKNFTVPTNMEKEKQMEQACDGPSPSRARFSKKLMAGKTAGPPEAPFDTTLASATYPEPPVVGTAAHVAQGKGHITYHPEARNIDEELQRKALARCRFSNAAQNFTIFDSNKTIEPSSARQVSLRESVETRFKERDEASSASRKGKLISEQKYRATSLW